MLVNVKEGTDHGRVSVFLDQPLEVVMDHADDCALVRCVLHLLEPCRLIVVIAEGDVRDRRLLVLEVLGESRAQVHAWNMQIIIVLIRHILQRYLLLSELFTFLSQLLFILPHFFVGLHAEAPGDQLQR